MTTCPSTRGGVTTPRPAPGGHGGQHDDLPEHRRGYDASEPLLRARCHLLDALELVEQAVLPVAAIPGPLTEPMREALAFHAIRLRLLADALSEALRPG